MNESIICALVGLVGAVSSNSKTADTDKIIRQALVECLDDTLPQARILELVDRIHEEKFVISPNCASCKNPCGNTSDLAADRVYSEDVGKNLAREEMLVAAAGLAANTPGPVDMALVYKAIAYFGYDYDEKNYRKLTAQLKSRKNIVLIGMPGAGKSTVGVVLAKILGYEFEDSDLVIQKKENRLLREIIEQDGVDGFIAIENRINASIEGKNKIIATGGSVVYGSEAMEHLREIGTVVYLRLSFDTIDSRLSNIKGRGVVLREGQTLKDLYEERIPLYEKYADLAVDSDGLSVEDTIAKIIELCDLNRDC